MTRLRECPFDHSRDVAVEHFNGDYHVKCKRCGAQGPTADTWAEAERLWNHRDGSDKH
ncbi:Lar family restriction alleviation protein [Mesorhizobium sp. M0816]|uniref:Lar family restriction alleviation protein n=1 Tax=Mesorhizobium sp. M0816 TaxID=2957006 RepID=UPI003337BE7B